MCILCITLLKKNTSFKPGCLYKWGLINYLICIVSGRVHEEYVMPTPTENIRQILTPKLFVYSVCFCGWIMVEWVIIRFSMSSMKVKLNWYPCTCIFGMPPSSRWDRMGTFSKAALLSYITFSRPEGESVKKCINIKDLCTRKFWH